MPNILVYPRDPNPYQERLYQALPAGIAVRYVNVLPDSRLHAVLFAPRLVKALVAGRLRGNRIFHLHWLYPFTVPQSIPGHRLWSLLQTLFFIWFIRALRYQLVWTVHNVLPHEPQTSNDRFVARRLAVAASAKIVHSTVTVAQMQALGMDTQRVHVIPHANYIDTYPSAITPAAARQSLGLAVHDRVILFFGIIRPHKGLEELLEAFHNLPPTAGGASGGTPSARNDSEHDGGSLSRQDSHAGNDSTGDLSGQNTHVKLIIAGSCTDPALQSLLNKAKKDPRIIVHDHHITDTAVATYFKACDIVCLPFKAVTTSGSALLALSFGKPLVAPRAGALLDIPGSAALLYDPAKTPLASALQRAIAEPAQLQAVGQAAYTYAATLSQPTIAAKTAAVYTSLRAK